MILSLITNRIARPSPSGALLCLCLLTIGSSTPAQNAPTNPPASDRFLLIVETSPGMQARATNVLRTIGRLFSSGLDGQLRPGDTIGVWTYDAELRTGKFPLKRWTPQTSREITGAIVRFLQQQSYNKPSRLAPVLAQLTNVVANSERITVLLVSDGHEAPVGTPFDAQIAEAYRPNAAEQQEQSMPFITVLRAVRGEFTGFRVNTPPWPVEFPPFPANLPPVAAPVTKENSPPPLPVTPAIVPVPEPVVTNNVSPPPTNPPVSSEVAAAPAAAQTNQITATVPAPPPVVSNVAPVSTTKKNTVPTPLREPVPATAAVAEPKIPFIPILIGVGVVLAGFAVICFALLKRSRETPRVSLITRSMNKDGK